MLEKCSRTGHRCRSFLATCWPSLNHAWPDLVKIGRTMFSSLRARERLKRSRHQLQGGPPPANGALAPWTNTRHRASKSEKRRAREQPGDYTTRERLCPPCGPWSLIAATPPATGPRATGRTLSRFGSVKAAPKVTSLGQAPPVRGLKSRESHSEIRVAKPGVGRESVPPVRCVRGPQRPTSRDLRGVLAPVALILAETRYSSDFEANVRAILS